MKNLYIKFLNKAPSIGIALFILLVATVYINRASAGEEEIVKLQNRISELKAQIVENQTEYKGLSDSIGEDRARCELARAKETQMSKLNGANTAKRTEIDLLSGILERSDSAIHAEGK